MTRVAFCGVFVVLAGLAACSSVTDPLGMEDPFGIPQPFKGMERNDNMIAQAIRVSVLVVDLPKGIDEDRALVLRDRVIELAQAQDIPALAESSVRGWGLSGQAAKIQAGRGAGGGVILWRLTDPDGAERAKFSIAYKSLHDDGLRSTARETVGALDAALLRPGTQVAETVAPEQKPIVWIGAIKGAPGDGNQALARALGGILPMKGVAVEEARAKAQWRVEGVVKVVPGRDGQDVVTLTWRMLDAQGKEAGSITQENAVPRGRLSKPWREVAGFAAEAAAEGIAQLIQQVTAGPKG